MKPLSSLGTAALLVLAGLASAQEHKLSPRLRALQRRLPAPAVGPLGAGAAARPAVSVFLRLAPGASPAALAGATPGLRLRTQAGPVVTATVPWDELGLLSLHPAVRSIGASPRARPLNDVARGSSKSGSDFLGVASTALGVSGYSGVEGQNVIVGVVDTGIDFRHPDFLNASNQSRLLFLWDQAICPPGSGSCPNSPAPPHDYGEEHTQAELNASLGGAGCLSDIDNCSIAQRDTDGHGTHVAGTAVSSSTVFTGLAPKADLIVVKTTFGLADVVDAVSYIFGKAFTLGRPAVVNLSLGTQYGPHDGTSDFSEGVGALTGAGRLVVAAAGNERGDKIHSSATATTSYLFDIRGNGSADQTDLHFLDFWHEGDDEFDVEVCVNAACSGTIASGSDNESSPPTLSGLDTTIYNAVGTNPNGDKEVVVVFDGASLALGTVVTVEFTKTSGDGGRIDGWDTTLPHTLDFQDEVEATLVGAPSDHPDVVSVAAYASRASWTDLTGDGWLFGQTAGALASFSSPGPNRDGLQKPDIAAPGTAIASTLSQSHSPPTCAPSPAGDDCMVVPPTGVHRINQGTSMASPVVAGIAAMRLQVAPTLTPAQFLAVLLQKARSDPKTGSLPNSDWGYGKILGTPPAYPAPPAPTGSAPSTTRIDWSWTDQTGNNSETRVLNAAGTVDLSGTLSAGAVSFSQLSLSTNTSHSVRVAVANEVGASTSPVSSTVHTRAAAPQSPVIIAAGETFATVQWSVNQNPAGTEFELLKSVDDFAADSTIAVPFSAGVTVDSATAYGLTSGIQYWFKVRARNGAGVVTGLSASATAVLLGTPTNLAGQGISTSQVQFTWDAVVGASSYNLYEPDLTPLGSAAGTTHTVGSLSPNELAGLRVSGVNALGEGPLGPAASGYSLAAVPGTPSLSGVPDHDSLPVSWAKNGNLDPTFYRLELDPNNFPGGVPSAAVVVVLGTQTPVTVDGLTPNTKYWLRSRAFNGQGVETAVSGTGSGVTRAAAPASLILAQGFDDHAVVSWSAQGNPGTTPYELQLSLDDFVSPPTTVIPFASNHTASSATIPSLIQNTNYYARVRARNQEVVNTAFSNTLSWFTQANSVVQAVPAGAAADVQVQNLQVLVPPGGFGTAVTMTLSPPTSFPAGVSFVGPLSGAGAGIEIDTGGTQPSLPLTVSVGYVQSAITALNLREQFLVLARYDPGRGAWLPLPDSQVDLAADKVTATTPHLSTFQLMEMLPSSTLAAVKAFPVPLLTSRGQQMQVSGLPAGARLRVYTIGGKLLRDLEAPGNLAIWDGRNGSGEPVASGIYLLAVSDPATGAERTLKVIVER